MRIITLSAVTLAIVAASTAAVAAESSGHFYTHVTSEKKIDLPDGNTAHLVHYFIQNATDHANDPMNNLAGSCSGQFIESRDGKTLAGSGICFTKNTNGDSLSRWWKVDEAGTANCPDICGSFGLMPGTGKFKGVTGGGTFKRTHQFGDVASSGTYKLTYSGP